MLHKPLTTLTIWPTTVIRTLTRATSTKRRDRTTLLSPSPVSVDPKLHKEALLISSVSHTTRVQNPLCNLHSIPQRKYENQNCQEVSRIWPSGAQNFSTYTRSKSKPCAIFHLPIRLATSFGYQYRVTSPVLSSTHQGRSSHTSAETSVKLDSGQMDDHQSVVVTGGERSLVIPAVWLRDHCMSERYFNHETQQKNVDPDLLANNLKIDSVGLTGKDNSVRIACKWLFYGTFRSCNCKSVGRSQFYKKNFYLKRIFAPFPDYFFSLISFNALSPICINLR